VLVVRGTRVPRVELACCRVGCDGELMTARPGRAALRLLSESGRPRVPPAGALAWHGELARRVHMLGARHVVRFVSWSETESARANELLVVRGGDWSEGLPLLGNLSGKLPTSREQDVLPVMVLTGIFGPPSLESWPSRCQWCQKTPLQE
jgi:hypothetical protein